MADSIKFIFKTLVKVPIIILVCYLIFNIFGFTFTYFRLMGLSYVVMQTAVENNYIPASEAQTLDNYLNSLQTYIVSDLAIGCDTDASNDAGTGPYVDIKDPSGGDNRRVQYGTPITVTVSGNFNWIFPLVNTADSDGNLTDSTGAATDERLSYNENRNNNIVIQYTVPGLKYYPDLS